jgi:hypothetical protein
MRSLIMSSKNLTILGIVAVLMVVWAAIQSRVSSRPGTEPEGPSYLILGLDTSDIGSIVVGTGQDAVTLKRRGAGFVVTNKDDYPAVMSKISELITSCLDIKTVELYTDEAAYHEDLGVTQGAASGVVKFLTHEPNSTVLAGVIIGKSKELGQGTYVRLISADKALSDKVYVASNVPQIGSRPVDYIEQDVFAVNREDINSVTVSSENGEYTLIGEEDGKRVVLQNVPAGKRAKGSECDRVFAALSNLRFEDVKKRSSGLVFDRRFVCKLKNSTVYTLNIAQEESKTYVRCQAEFTGTVTRPTKDESDEELKKKEAKLKAWDEAQKFAEKHQGWIYEIAEWKAKDLTKELSELIEDDQKPKEVEQTLRQGSGQAEEPNSASVMQLLEPNSVK